MSFVTKVIDFLYNISKAKVSKVRLETRYKVLNEKLIRFSIMIDDYFGDHIVGVDLCLYKIKLITVVTVVKVFCGCKEFYTATKLIKATSV